MKILKNYAYNFSYQLLVIILPILTTPYVTRIFSSEDLGTYGYFNSIVTYFILLATLGVANYGTKEVSANRKNIQPTFWGIYSLQVVAAFISIVLYLLLCWSVPSCLLYTSDAADDLLCVDLGGCRILKTNSSCRRRGE